MSRLEKTVKQAHISLDIERLIDESNYDEDYKAVLKKTIKQQAEKVEQLEQSKCTNKLYNVVNEMMCHLGAYGDIDTRNPLVIAVMDELYNVDEGVYKPLPSAPNKEDKQ